MCSTSEKKRGYYSFSSSITIYEQRDIDLDVLDWKLNYTCFREGCKAAYHHSNYEYNFLCIYKEMA